MAVSIIKFPLESYMGFDSPNNYSGVDARTTIRVELESAQVRNDVWKRIFSIEELPPGVG